MTKKRKADGQITTSISEKANQAMRADTELKLRQEKELAEKRARLAAKISVHVMQQIEQNGPSFSFAAPGDRLDFFKTRISRQHRPVVYSLRRPFGVYDKEIYPLAAEQLAEEEGVGIRVDLIKTRGLISMEWPRRYADIITVTSIGDEAIQAVQHPLLEEALEAQSRFGAYTVTQAYPPQALDR